MNGWASLTGEHHMPCVKVCVSLYQWDIETFISTVSNKTCLLTNTTVCLKTAFTLHRNHGFLLPLCFFALDSSRASSGGHVAAANNNPTGKCGSRREEFEKLPVSVLKCFLTVHV